jgi:hypothetical protein
MYGDQGDEEAASQPKQREVLRYSISLWFTSTGGKLFAEGYFESDDEPSQGIPDEKQIAELATDIVIEKAMSNPSVSTPNDLNAIESHDMTMLLLLDGETVGPVGEQNVAREITDMLSFADVTIVGVGDWSKYMEMFGEFGVPKPERYSS